MELPPEHASKALELLCMPAINPLQARLVLVIELLNFGFGHQVLMVLFVDMKMNLGNC